MRILLVDDNMLFAASAQRFLSTFDSVEVVAVARGGREALDHLERQRADMVLMDLNMHGMNGLEATRRIKALDPGIRIIVVSLDDTEEFRSAATNAGAENFVSKQDFVMRLPALIKGREAGGGLEAERPPTGQ